MKAYLECIPCLTRQALKAVRLATCDDNVHVSVIRRILATVSTMDFEKSPPEMAQVVHRLIRDLSGNTDPYRALKDRYNRLALNLYFGLKQRIESAQRSTETAVRLAIAGNIIDFGAPIDENRLDLNHCVLQALSAPLFGRVDGFIDALSAAESILYLGDNAGEIVFDRLLIERLPREKITYVVKGGPIINDATMSDAVSTGMTDVVRVIDNGSDAPGTLLSDCSERFQSEYARADMIIAKGQANYETLSEADNRIFFLLRAKCPVVAWHMGCDVGSYVIQKPLYNKAALNGPIGAGERSI